MSSLYNGENEPSGTQKSSRSPEAITKNTNHGDPLSLFELTISTHCSPETDEKVDAVVLFSGLKKMVSGVLASTVLAAKLV